MDKSRFIRNIKIITIVIIILFIYFFFLRYYWGYLLYIYFYVIYACLVNLTASCTLPNLVRCMIVVLSSYVLKIRSFKKIIIVVWPISDHLEL